MNRTSRNGTLTPSNGARNGAAEPPPRAAFPFHLARRLVASFPLRRRAYLSALYTLLVAASRRGEEFVRESQVEIAWELGLSRSTIQRLEVELEELGALYSHQNPDGPGTGRALELIPLDQWAPEVHGRSVENSAPRVCETLPPRPADATPTRIAPNTARARQSIPEERLTRGAPAPARRMFGFLSKASGLSARRWVEAIPELERKIRERGEEWTWSEVERIAVASRTAINPGGYAYSCLFPEGLPKTRGAALHALEVRDNAGPLFEGLDQDPEPGNEEALEAGDDGL